MVSVTYPLPTRLGRSNPQLCVRGRAHPPPRRRLSVIGSVWVSPQPRALRRERQGPVRGSRGGKGAEVGPVLGDRLAGSLRSWKLPAQLSKMKKLKEAHLRKGDSPVDLSDHNESWKETAKTTGLILFGTLVCINDFLKQRTGHLPLGELHTVGEGWAISIMSSGVPGVVLLQPQPVTPDLLMTPSDQGDVDLDVDFAADRGNWTGKLDFLLSCIGYCVGLGNVWRFPYRAYTNGGGAFLVPYFLMLAICGIPLFFLELSLGQFSSLGPLAVWKISPLFKGAGAAMLLIVGLVAIYYNMIIAYVLFYLFASLTSNLPWEHCGNWWNTERCLEHRGPREGNGVLPLNLSSTVSPSEEYWSRYVLHIQGSQGIGRPGEIRWNLCLCLLLAWVIVFLCILKGVKSSGKVVYFTATFPYLILVMLLIRGVTLPGAWKGIQFYLTPQFHHLLSSKVWIEAALQIFYSLGVGFGGLLTFASYNTFHQNIYRDTFIVTLGNAITSILAGFAIFSVLGYMSQELGVPVDQVAKAGPGLAFVVYPQAMTMLPLSPFWSFLFFFMLLTLGLDSQFAFLETIVTAVTDEFPYYLRPKKAVFSGLICVAMYLMGLILTTDGGMYWLVLLDDYSASFGLMVVVITTCLAVTRVYGIQRFCRDIHMMLGFKPGLYFRACWLFLSPATLLALLVYSIVKYQPSEYGNYRFPAWAELLGILMGLLSCLMIPAGMLVAVLREEGSLWERLQQASRPAIDWGPSLEENRTGMYVATLAGSQSPKPLMVHMRKYGGITSFENTAIEVDREIAEEEEESMM
ncbi:sodium-dependent proline transporter [Apodemus sylvaticus]|uniref:sodium-dependent proline transporter n=1 Tax=Apodemus sylvaticus TaxID=10129 RepID=UPI002243D775|nr:sodium-dependent proline transporter [Apodemus sylvaticus]